MSVRAKFEVRTKGDGRVLMDPVIDGSEENKAFFAATPGGHIDLQIMNEAALEQFEEGKAYYVDFTPAE